MIDCYTRIIGPTLSTFFFFFFLIRFIPIYSHLLLTHYVTIEKTIHICSFNHITFVMSHVTYLNNTHV